MSEYGCRFGSNASSHPWEWSDLTPAPAGRVFLGMLLVLLLGLPCLRR